jgi:N-acetylmuramoyl-L-alanine amidase
MPKVHVVERGDCLSKIARQYGFADYRVIWNAPENDALREVRRDPNVLFPGDEVTVPDREDKTFSCASERTHTFRVKLPPAMLRIVMCDNTGAPLKNEDYRIEYGGDGRAGKTDGSGLLKEKVPATIRDVTLRIRHYVLELAVGDLDPMTDVGDDGLSGICARLHNLGYDPGPAGDEVTERLEAALAMFQRDQELEPTGEPDDDALAALREAHGC